MRCPKCNRIIEGNPTFCPYCGERIDNLSSSQTKQKMIDGKEMEDHVLLDGEYEEKEGNKKLRKINIILSFVSVILIFIFSLFLRIKVGTKAIGVKELCFDIFVNFFKNGDFSISAIGGLIPDMIMGVIFLVCIVSGFIYTICATVSFVKALKGDEKHIDKSQNYAISFFGTYISTVLILLGCYTYVGGKYSALQIVLIVVASILVASTATISLLLNIDKIKKEKRIIPIVLSLVIIVFAIVIAINISGNPVNSGAIGKHIYKISSMVSDGSYKAGWASKTLVGSFICAASYMSILYCVGNTITANLISLRQANNKRILSTSITLISLCFLSCVGISYLDDSVILNPVTNSSLVYTIMAALILGVAFIGRVFSLKRKEPKK